jgi:hypothetical protein
MDSLREAILSRLQNALLQTRAMSEELSNAKLRLDDADVFTPELEILSRYDGILRREIIDNGGSVLLNQIAAAPQPVIQIRQPAADMNRVSPEMEALRSSVAGLFREIGLSFPRSETAVVAIAPFAIRDGSEPP